MKRSSLFYKILFIFLIIGILPALLLSLRLVSFNQQLLIAGGENWSVSPQGIEQIEQALMGESLAYLIYSLITVAIFAVFISGGLIKPLRNLNKIILGFLAGDDQPEIVGESIPTEHKSAGNEIDQVSTALQNIMGDLTHLRQELESQVLERTQALEHQTRQLQAASAVAQDSASIRDLNELLSRVTQLISENFGYYHIGIFLLDDSGEFAILSAANSAGGLQMLARGHKLNIAETSIVGYVANTRQPRVALSVGVDAVHFKNPYLPETRSEMALPLITGAQAEPDQQPGNADDATANASGRLWGVLDVQSKKEQAFTQQDIAVLQILANQVAIAIENAHLFNENQRALAELQAALETSRKLYGEMTSDAWRKLLHTRPETGYIAASHANEQTSDFSAAPGRGSNKTSGSGPDASEEGAQFVIPATGEWLPDMVIAQQSGQNIQSDAHTLIVPIRIRQFTPGVLRLRKPDHAPAWSRTEIDLITTLTDQLSVALESARLYDETRRRAERERLTGEITAKLRTSNDPRVILQTAMSELRQALQASQVRATLHTVPQQQRQSNE